MAFTLTIFGRITKTPGGTAVAGMTVNMVKEVGSTVVDTDVTDVNGDYAVSVSLGSETGDDYYANPLALAPHYGDPGEGPSHPHEHTSYEDNFSSAFTNNNPTTTAVSNRSYEENSGSYTADFTMADADSDAMTAEKVAGESWGTVSQPNATTGRWTFDTTGVTPGVYTTFQYRAVDAYSGASTTRAVQVTITAANQNPVLSNPGNKSYLNESGDQTFQLSATDPDGDPITYSKQTGPTWVTVSTSGLVTVKTNQSTRGVHAVTFRAADNHGGTDDESITVTITNNAPVLTNPGNQQYTTNSGDKTLDLSATDADGDTKTYSKTAGAAWGTVNSSNGRITFAIGSTVAGTYSFTFQVSDGQGGTDSESFDVVLVDPVPSPFFQMQG